MSDNKPNGDRANHYTVVEDLEIHPGIPYKFSAREVVVLLRKHSNMTEQEAADAVTLAALPGLIADAQYRADDFARGATCARQDVEHWTSELARLQP